MNSFFTMLQKLIYRSFERLYETTLLKFFSLSLALTPSVKSHTKNFKKKKKKKKNFVPFKAYLCDKQAAFADDEK